MNVFKEGKLSFSRMYTLAFLLLGAIFVFFACYPGSPLSVNDLDVVATFHDPNANFASKKTYAMPDTVLHVVDSTKTDDISREFDAMMLAQVAQNMEKMGYTRVMDPVNQKFDVAVLVRVTTSTHTGYQYYPWWGYWGWWPGWGGYPGYGPGWGGWYPWYPGGTVYQYTTGTLFVDMVDPESPNNEEEALPSIWVAAMNGLLSTSASSTISADRIKRNIDLAFEQSPYLGEGK